ncbi:hypothetical protein [Streptomyces sp. KL116D]|uniref:hypothetical protein n=1 Tax=Streptomyces sp. KL116D TaxID=3045152 RepID=UPI003555C8E0
MADLNEHAPGRLPGLSWTVREDLLAACRCGNGALAEAERARLRDALRLSPLHAKERTPALHIDL